MTCFSSYPAYRYVFLICVLLESLLLSGVMYGWPALVFVLKDEGFFEDMCKNTVANMTNTDCSGRDEMFTLYFALITTVGSLVGLVVGYLFRTFGTRTARIVDSLGYAVGCLLIAFAEVETHWMICLGGILMMACGISLLMTTFQITELFPTSSSLIVGLLNGAMDSSIVVTLIIKVLYSNYTISRKVSFLVLACISIATLISTFGFFPKMYMEDTVNHSNSEKEIKDANKDNSNKLETVADKQSWLLFIKKRLFSILYCTFNIWTSINFLCYIYFLGTLNSTLERLTDGNEVSVSYYTNVVSIVLFCAIVASTLGGYMYDFQRRIFNHIDDIYLRSQMSAILPLCVTTTLAILLSTLAFINHEYVIYSSAITVTLLRSLFYASLTVYLKETFPLRDFGLLYSINQVVMALTGMLQYPFFQWGNLYFGAFLHVDITLTILCVVSFVHPINVYVTARRQQSKTYDFTDKSPSHDVAIYITS